MARILVACEESQATTKAFRALGHEAFPCDLFSPTNIVGKGERTVFGSGKSHPKWYADALKNAKTKEERQTLRSKTFQGMARAFTKQWGDFVNNI